MAAPNRIPTGLYKADKLIAGRSATDLLIVTGVPACFATFLTVAGIVTPFQYLGLLLISFVLAIYIYRKAGVRDAVEYLQGEYNWRRKPSVVSRFSNGDETEESDELLADGSGEADPDDLVEQPESVRFWQSEEKFGEAPYVKDVFPDFDAVRRKDGVIVAGAQVEGTQVYLRNPGAKDRLVRQFRQVFRDVAFDFSIYTTTDSFDLTDHADRMDDAGRHPEVQENPILRQLHESYMENVATNPSVVSAKQRVIYVVVEADPQEVHDILERDDDDDESSIAAVNFLRSALGSDTSNDGDYSKEELQDLRAAIKQLHQRRTQLMRSIEGIDGVSCEPASASELVGRLRGHWQGPHRYDDISFPASTITPPKELVDESSEQQDPSVES